MSTVNYDEMEHYLEYLRLHGRRETTIDGMRDILTHLLRMLASDDRPTVLAAIRLEDMAWVAQNLHIKDTTKSEYIRAFSRFSVQSGGPDWGKLLDILYNRAEAERVWITLEDYRKLIEHASPTMRMILVLGAMMGLRRFEIAGLKDADIVGTTMTIRGKGHGPDGLVVKMKIPAEVVHEIERYREWKESTGCRDSGDGFLIQSTRYDMLAGVKPVTISQWVCWYGRDIGVTVTTHSLRRLYATTLCNTCNCDHNTLRILLRHADISTTLRCYVEPDPSKQRTAVASLMGIMGDIIESY